MAELLRQDSGLRAHETASMQRDGLGTGASSRDRLTREGANARDRKLSWSSMLASTLMGDRSAEDFDSDNDGVDDDNVDSDFEDAEQDGDSAYGFGSTRHRVARAFSLSSYLGVINVFSTANGDEDVDYCDSEGGFTPLSPHTPISGRRNSWAGSFSPLRPSDATDTGLSAMDSPRQLSGDNPAGLRCVSRGGQPHMRLRPLVLREAAPEMGSSTPLSSPYSLPPEQCGEQEPELEFEPQSTAASKRARYLCKINPDGKPMTKEEELEAMYNSFASGEQLPTPPEAEFKKPAPVACPKSPMSTDCVTPYTAENDVDVDLNDSNEDTFSVIDEDCCFICMAPFSDDDESERIELPCVRGCNKTPVHAKCIFEWREHRNNSKEASGTCPLCRGPLGYIKYLPPDPLNRAGFVVFEARREFVLHPVPREHGTLRCFVRVTPSGWLGVNSYQMYIQAPCALPYPQGSLPLAEGPVQGDQLLMCAKKRNPFFGSPRVDITLDRNGKDYDTKGPNYIGHVNSNFIGLEHTVVQPYQMNDKRTGYQELACVMYQQNRIGMGMGPRRMRVCIPVTEEHENSDEPATTAMYRPSRKKDSLASLLQSSTPDELISNQIVQYGENREPSWLEAIQAYSLDFYGRVTLPSNKNFQLCLHDDPEAADTCVLQFGKIVSHESNDVAVYTLDFQYPMSPLQAFGICISAADRKFMCA